MIDGLSKAELEELIGETHAQLSWLYNEHGVGWLYTEAERKEINNKSKFPWTWCVCTEEYGTWCWTWEHRENTHADGECSCWCPDCEDHRTWYWAAGPGAKKLADTPPAVEPEACTCLAEDKEYLAGTAENPRYPVYHQAASCQCRCMVCRAWREYQAHLDSKSFREYLEEQRLKEMARREEIARRDREEAERARYLASPEGQAEIAAAEAEQKRKEAEARERRQAEFDRDEELSRQHFQRMDTDPDMVRSSGDPVRDLQALVAACSGTSWRTAADPSTGELRETWDDRQPGDQECYPLIGKLFEHQGQLVELRGRGCSKHRAEVEQWRRKGLPTTDYEYCLSECRDMEPYPHRIHGGQALKSYLDRQYEGVFHWTGQLLSDPGTGKRARFAGCSWESVTFDDADYKNAMAADDWQVPHLAGIAPLPTLRPDGTMVICTGYDVATGFWFTPAGTPGQRSMGASSRRSGVTGSTHRAALASGLPHRLLEFAQEVRIWEGTMTQLKERLGWPGTPKALSAAIWKDELTIMALGVIIERGERLGETRAPGIRIRHQMQRSERSNVPRALPPVVLPGKIDPER